MNKINTLNTLIKTINNKNILNSNIPNLYNLKNTINKYNGNDWIKYNKYSNNYDKQLVYRNKLYELFVITWMPFSESKIHDHSYNGCLYSILDGILIEELYDKHIKLNNVSFLKKRDCGYINNEMYYHKMINNTNKITTSLHLYSPPSYKMNIFD